MKGTEQDFNRVQVSFPYQTADECAQLMTDLVGPSHLIRSSSA